VRFVLIAATRPGLAAGRLGFQTTPSGGVLAYGLSAGTCALAPSFLGLRQSDHDDIGEPPRMGANVDELKLVALDRDDIEVISAHVQDALVRIADVFWQPSERRFVIALNRFDWVTAAETVADPKADYRRCRTALRFERVLSCKSRNLDQSNKNTQLNLLAVEFAERDSPAGTITLTFSGGGVIRLDVECVEAELADLGEVFAAAARPNHFTVGSATA
jgi:Protein of unknown function (DUF2948)